MEHASIDQFKQAPSQGPFQMRDAIALARNAVAEMTDLAIDGVTQCHRNPEGKWRIEIDVLVRRARMGDNDMMATYAIELSGDDGEVENFARIRRFHREDRDEQ